MNIKNGGLGYRFTLILIAILFSIGLAGCKLFPFLQTELPFEYLTEMPQDAFLFFAINDDDYKCLDDLCGCPISEAPAPAFVFIEGELELRGDYFDPGPENENWAVFRKKNSSIALYGFNSQWTTDLQLISTYPFTFGEGNFVILGVDSLGQIQVRSKDGYAIIPVGESIEVKQPELKSAECKVQHKYTLTNYGFIKDEDVRFYEGGIWK